MSNKETLYEGKFLRLIKEHNWEYVERVGRNEAVIIIPVICEGKDRSLLLIREWRTPLQAYTYGFPAGIVGDTDNNEELNKAVARELEEETGYKAETIELLADGHISSGLTTEKMYFFLADGLKRVSEGGGIEDEDITVHTVKLSEIDTWLKNVDGLVDPKIYIGLYFINRISNERRLSHSNSTNQ